MRKICVVITARPSYSRIKTLLTEINSNKNLELQLILGASALIQRYGSVIDIVEKDGFEISKKIYSSIDGDSPLISPKSTAILISELSSAFLTLKPDIVVTIADRYETIATSIAASYMNIPLAHIQGGEVTGNIDEKVRHANTKFADYHFVSSLDSYNRVLNLGENPEFIFNTGCPSIDLAKNIGKLNFNPYEKYGGVGIKPDFENGYIVVMQHPVTNEYNHSKEQIIETIEAIIKLDMTTFWFWPNVDSGTDSISKTIRKYRERKCFPKVHFFKNFDPIDFLTLLKNSKCLIGNSSVGIRECSYLNVPVLNIGSRQNKRLRGKNVMDCENDRNEIINKTQSLLNNKISESSNIYGDGNSGFKISEILSTVGLTSHKTIKY